MAIDSRTLGFTLLALIAFASNSLLTRWGLGSGRLDAATFTAIRLGAGAIVLALVVRIRSGGWAPLRARGALGPLALLAYAVPFSFAYLRIGAAVGALVLFGVVQLTMIGIGIARGERPSPRAWAGLAIAATGLAALTVPSATRPNPVGLLLMTVAGVAWAAYSIAGKSASDSLVANARAFLWSSPVAILAAALLSTSRPLDPMGVTLAVISGAVTSGLGYAIWYLAVRGLTITQAAVAQLSVPVIAAVGAAGLLGERISARLVFSGLAVLCGVALVLTARSPRR